MIVIGITGSIGMGKTTIASMFTKLNIPIHDSDATVRSLLENDDNVISQIKENWPSCIISTKNKSLINKVKLSDIIFKKKSQKKILEGIIHPRVLYSRDLFLKKNLITKNKLVGLDVPLLFETRGDKICNYVFLAYASQKIQKKRVLKRKNMTLNKFENITNNQMSELQKKMKNPIVIRTDFGKTVTFVLVLINLIKIFIIEKTKI
ncbi:dephospho-CoA kinase [Alphaproteobacteria bacterium]|nr:dephospho-CoA kinase [Alphaproteobacteria bacterium]